METQDPVESLKERFKTDKIDPYGQVITVPTRIFDPSWEATLERQGHRVYVNAMNGEPYCFVSVKKGRPRHVDSPKESPTAKSTASTVTQLNLRKKGKAKEEFVQRIPIQRRPGPRSKKTSLQEKPAQEKLPQGKLILIPIELLKHSTTNPREHFKEADLKALATTIKRHGLLQPILVRPEGGHYEVVVGERRLRACKIAGLQTIPSIIVDDLTDRKLVEIQLVENLQRKNLSAYEELKVVKALKNFGLSANEIAVRCGMSHGKAGNLVYLAEHLPEEYQRQIASGRSRTHSPKDFTTQKALLIAKAQLPPDELKNVVDLIIQEGITATGLAQKLATKPKHKVSRVFSPASKEYWRQLTKKLREFANYWKNICKIEEWETTEKRFLQLTVELAKDLSEAEDVH